MCASICPTNAIQIVKQKAMFKLSINEEKCVNCDLCLKVCPRRFLDFNAISTKVCSFPGINHNKFLGSFISTYKGYAKDSIIRRGASSGGIVSSLLIFALEQRIIDGALVVDVNRKDPLELEAVIVKSRDQILSAAQSKYLPVPFDKALREIMKNKGRFAVVGLPCHIQGIRKIELQYPRLRKKIKLRFGLFCLSHAPLATLYLLKELKISLKDVRKIKYRDGKWPGQVVVELLDGNVKSVEFGYFGSLFSFFSPMHCRLCIDHTNELADISVGDAWLPELIGSEGWSIIISRTDEGEELLRKAEDQSVIKISNIKKDQVIESQKFALLYKKIINPALINMFNSINVEMPKYVSSYVEKASFIDYLLAILSCIIAKFTNRHFILNLPRYCLNKYVELTHHLANASYNLFHKNY